MANTAPRDYIRHVHNVEMIPKSCDSLTIFVSDIELQSHAFKFCGYLRLESRYSASNELIVMLQVTS